MTPEADQQTNADNPYASYEANMRQEFINCAGDRLSELISSGRDLSEYEIHATIRDLPPKPGFNVDEVEVGEIEVMLVMPGDTAAHHVTRQL